MKPQVRACAGCGEVMDFEHHDDWERCSDCEPRALVLCDVSALARVEAERDALAAELAALRRVVRRLPAGQSFAAALRAAGDEAAAAAVERALKGAP